MREKAFVGDLVRLEIVDPEASSVLFNRWAQDSEYLRMMDSNPAFTWPAKMNQEFYEKQFNQMYAFSIKTLNDGRPIGMIDLSGFSPDWTNGWVGIGIGEKEYWGAGYGTDAMRIILRYAFDDLGLHRVTLNVFEYNLRGLRSYEKCGFKIEGRERQWLWRDGQFYDLVYMGILKEDWLKMEIR